jgi:high-affinity iron transporter
VPARVGPPLAGLLLLAAASATCAPAAPLADPAEGRTLYAINGCPACHGDDGRGDGPLATVSMPRPRDFRDAAAFAGPRTVERIAEVIASGLTAMPNPMPAYGHLSEGDRRHLAAYVLSLGDAPR